VIRTRKPGRSILLIITKRISHHGSRTFFKTTEEDEDVYEDHIKEISPSYLIISAPKQKDSPHGHPHDDAWEIYQKYVDEDNILHLGGRMVCVIVDIDSNGNIDVQTDEELIAEYGKGNDGSDPNTKGKNISIVTQTTRIDNKPMGYAAMV
jgi:competence protein ComEC